MRYLVFCMALFLPGMLMAQLSPNADSVWMRANYIKEEVMVPMRDGAKLFTAIYRPKDISKKHPVLMQRTPYSCAPYGVDTFRPFWASYHKEYIRAGYIFVFQDVRGRFMSEGQFVDVRPFNPSKKGVETDEASDTYDLLDWVVKNVPANNGRVGVFGISYPGFYSTMAALSAHPALKAVSPQAPVTDWFEGDDFHHNGAFLQMDAFEFYSNFGVPRPLPTQKYNPGFKRSEKEPDAYKFYLQAATMRNLNDRYLKDSIAFWNDLMKHPNYDTWWKMRNPRNHVANIKPAMLVVGGNFDAEDCFGAWNLYKAIEKNNPSTQYNKIVMGPWFHGAWGGRSTGENLGKVKFGSKTSEWYQEHIEYPFFQQYLNETGTADMIKEANVFFTGENQWRQFDQWPPKNMHEKALYLLPNHALGFAHPPPLGAKQRPDSTMTFTQYISDPANPVPHDGTDTIKTRTREYMSADQRFAAARPDVISFTSEPLSAPLTLGGPLVADLVAGITTTDADFVVKLIDVFPADVATGTTPYNQADSVYKNDTVMNGYQMLVRGEVMRGRFRNSLEKPEPFVPNKMTRVKFTLPDVAHTFLPGHRIMVQLQSSWFPLADRNPQQFVDIYKASASDFIITTVRVFHTEGVSSKLVLPVLE